MELNRLYYGDNLTILRRYFPDESVDLIYLDPPFNSNASYNILFKEPGTGGEQSAAQITAFDDTWHWTLESEQAFQEIAKTAPATVVNLMTALKDAIHRNDLLAYLTMMCIRLLELKRVLKQTGSLYLHCDPTASHYLKILLDAIFGKENFRNEIVWLYKGRELSHRNYNKKHDIIFFYTKSDKYRFNWEAILEPLEESSKKALARYKDEKGYFIVRYKKGGGFAPIEKEGEGTYRQYVPKGVPPRDWFYADYARKSELLGYRTQKPEALLERIIKASSNEGDTVLDPFCGCGTAVVAAHRLNRKWIGIDITHLAINLIKGRLKDNFPEIELKAAVGEPVDLAGAEALALQNRYQFQWWALSLIDARPFGDKKKGADTGIDGYFFFNDAGETKKAVVQVKSGKVGVSQIRELNAVVAREKAEMGFFLTLKTPTAAMKEAATGEGFYLDSFGNKYPKLQLFTIEELLNNKSPDTPQKVGLFKSYRNTKRRKNKRNKK
ncbi:MAG: DNA methyltransferase [Methanophagales archaeon]|nr:DNA methyltransferase [Methanophagales archaeon]